MFGKHDPRKELLKSTTKDELAFLPEKNEKNGKPSPNFLATLGDMRMALAAMPDKPEQERQALLTNARKCYVQALEDDPECLGALLGMARLMTRIEDKERAGEYYRKATEAHPKDPRTWYELAMHQSRLQDHAAALESLTKAVQLEPENNTYRRMAGFTLIRMGRIEEGYQALLHGSKEVDARYNLARMLYQLRQDDACRQQLAMVLQLDPQYEPAAALLAELNGTPAALPNLSPSQSALQAPAIQPVGYQTTVAYPSTGQPYPSTEQPLPAAGVPSSSAGQPYSPTSMPHPSAGLPPGNGEASSRLLGESGSLPPNQTNTLPSPAPERLPMDILTNRANGPAPVLIDNALSPLP